MKSWKTTACGILTIIAAVSPALKAMIDGDHATNPDWSLVAPLVTAGIAAIFARDNDKTSENVGAK